MTFHARLLGVWHVASQLADREEIHVRTITSMHGSSDQRCQEKHQNQKNAYISPLTKNVTSNMPIGHTVSTI